MPLPALPACDLEALERSSPESGPPRCPRRLAQAGDPQVAPRQGRRSPRLPGDQLRSRRANRNPGEDPMIDPRDRLERNLTVNEDGDVVDLTEVQDYQVQDTIRVGDSIYRRIPHGEEERFDDKT